MGTTYHSDKALGFVFIDFTLQIWGRGFDRGSTGVALRELKLRR